VRRIVAEITTHYAVSLGLLFYIYPWSVAYARSQFPRSVTVLSYLIAAAMITLFGLGLLFVSEKVLHKCHPTTILLTGCFGCTTALALVSFGIGTCGWDVPGTRLFGIFFAEWQFLTFFFKACLPLCLLAAVMEFKRLRQLPAQL
jgi:hypothetical protein